MRRSTFKLCKYSGGITHYAEVEVECAGRDAGGKIVVSPDAFAWLKEEYGPQAWEWPVCDDYRRAAVRGIEYALAHSAPPIGSADLAITIKKIHASPADTSDSSVAFAACHATWKALELTPSIEPRFEGREIIFE